MVQNPEYRKAAEKDAPHPRAPAAQLPVRDSSGVSVCTRPMPAETLRFLSFTHKVASFQTYIHSKVTFSLEVYFGDEHYIVIGECSLKT